MKSHQKSQTNGVSKETPTTMRQWRKSRDCHIMQAILIILNKSTSRLISPRLSSTQLLASTCNKEISGSKPQMRFKVIWGTQTQILTRLIHRGLVVLHVSLTRMTRCIFSSLTSNNSNYLSIKNSIHIMGVSGRETLICKGTI